MGAVLMRIGDVAEVCTGSSERWREGPARQKGSWGRASGVGVRDGTRACTTAMERRAGNTWDGPEREWVRKSRGGSSVKGRVAKGKR
eukprot:6190598-Pleurochrysis_carterae.AAC.1